MNTHYPRAICALALRFAAAGAACFFSTARVQAAAGDLFASDPTANAIRVYALDGTTRIFASGLDSPQGLAFDSFGNLFVADKGSGRIYKFTIDGTRTIYASGLDEPLGFALLGNQLAVAENGKDAVSRIDPAGIPQAFLDFASPFGVTFDKLNLYITGNEELNIVKPLNVVDTFSIPGSRDVAIDGTGNAFVSSSDGSVTRVAPTGATLTFASGLTTPNGLAFRPKRYSAGEEGVGDLFVAETTAGVVSHFAADGVRQVFATGGNPKFLAFERLLPGKLLNISTRADAQTGHDVLIGGFIVTGDAPKQVMIRAIGPSLSAAPAPVPGPLMDPVLELHMPDGSVVVNDDWKTDQKSEINDTGTAPTDDRESAMVATLEPGAYTAVVHGKGGAAGIALVEVYDLAPDEASELANISTRGFVGAGDNVMIGGFIIDPAESARVLIRAIGKSLEQAEVAVTDALQDPTLELRDNNGELINSNDNWTDTAEGEITATGIAPADAKESAILVNLAGGNYTAIVRGADDGVGVALVEMYKLP